MVAEKKYDGGPAFPQTCADALDVGMVHEGMRLRDWFAGQALAGLMTDAIRQENGSMPITIHDIAEKAFRLADAMLEARGDPDA